MCDNDRTTTRTVVTVLCMLSSTYVSGLIVDSTVIWKESKLIVLSTNKILYKDTDLSIKK